MTDLGDSAIALPGKIRNGSNGMTLRHVVESQQFTVPLLMELFDRSRGMERVVARGGSLDFQKKIMATVFYQPSTRTRFSFEQPCTGSAAACSLTSMRAHFPRKQEVNTFRTPAEYTAATPNGSPD